MRELPRFTEHGDHSKLRPLESARTPDTTVARWFADQARGREGLRVLDVGCGRGDTVAWLLEQGWDAYGFDVDARYIAQGADYLRRFGQEERLKLWSGGPYPYPPDHFDVVFSDQVFEHVADLAMLAQEVARVTKPGGLGLHVFPAKWLFVEPHMLTPAVHWLPKGRARRRAIRWALATGQAGKHFQDRPLDERVAIFTRYSEEETFYRSTRRIKRTLRDAGLAVDPQSVSEQRVTAALGRRVPAAVTPALGWLYRTVRVTYLSTRKPQAQAPRERLAE